MSEKFVFWENFKATADKLPDDLRLKFYDALTDYALFEKEPEDAVISALVNAIKPSLDKSDKRGGNHNPSGQNQHSVVKSGQNEVKSGQNEVKSGQSGQSFHEVKKIEEKNKIISQDKSCSIILQKKQKTKISLENVVDWESLFTYWEQNKKGGKYKNAKSRERQLQKLKLLTNDNFEFAKDAIIFCIDNNYQGFTDGSQLFYRGSVAPSGSKAQGEEIDNFGDYL